jgi:hypothetical protein
MSGTIVYNEEIFLPSAPNDASRACRKPLKISNVIHAFELAL